MLTNNTITAIVVAVILIATGALAVADVGGKAVERSATAAAIVSARCLVTAIDKAGNPIRPCK